MSWSELELGRESGFLNRVLAPRQSPVLNLKMDRELPLQRNTDPALRSGALSFRLGWAPFASQATGSLPEG